MEDTTSTPDTGISETTTEATTEAENSVSEQAATEEKGEGVSQGEAVKTQETGDTGLVRVKIDGKERDVPMRELIDRYQRASASDKRFQEAAKVRKQAENLIRGLREDPIGILRHPALGYTEDQINEMMEKALYERVQFEQMTPEQQELHKLKKKIAESEEEKKRAAETKREGEIKQLTDRYRTDYQKGIIEAIDGAKLPKTSGTVKRMAHYMLEGLKREVRLEPKDVVDLVRRDLNREFKEMYEEAPPDMLLELFGEKVAKKIREHDLQGLKAAPEAQKVEAKGVGDKPRKRLTKDEWKKILAERVR